MFSSDGAKDPNELHKRNPEGFQAALDQAELLTPTLQTYTAAELMDMTLPEPRWAVPDVLTEGVTIFAGRPKIGKSWLTLALGLGIAAGGKALGSIDVEAGEVLYAALEDNPQRIRDRLKSLLVEGEMAPERLHIIHRLPGFDALHLRPYTQESHLDFCSRLRSVYFSFGGLNTLQYLQESTCDGFWRVSHGPAG